MSSDSRYLIGIDLGTTNTALSYLDKQEELPQVKVLKIPQIIAPGEVDSLETLPSFLYLLDQSKASTFSMGEEKDICVGAYAKKIAGEQASKVVASAKSWLCAPGQDPSADILPPIEDAERKISPVDTMTHYLEHLAQAWNDTVADNPAEFIQEQNVILTVPASFNTLARELTVMAAEAAGLQVTLLEEPQAAFYSWIYENQEQWRDLLDEGESILVIDIGGGTTDFSLIGVENNDGNMGLKRIAVGNHLLLGGDNMDYTLAYFLQQKLKTRLNSRQFTALVHQCRSAKEKLLSEEAPELVSISILGTGSSLIGGSLKTELTQEEVQQFVIQAFLPDCEINAEVQNQVKSGLRSFGLNFESDAAISRHLAAFLRENDTLPKTVLFNGGVTKASQLRERFSKLIENWSGQEVQVLADSNPDLAVSKGAAWFAHVKQGNSIRIKAGSAFSYYIGLESSMPAIPGFTPPIDAICVIPESTEDGTSFTVPMDGLALLLGEDSQFRFFSSNKRKDDQLGSIVQDADLELEELPALHKFLQSIDGDSQLIPISLKSVFTEIGTVQVWAQEKDGEQNWRLEFDLEGEAE